MTSSTDERAGRQSQMIYFFIGTKAQLIKMAPVMRELGRREIPYRYIDSGQHARITSDMRQGFKLAEPDVSLRDTTNDITATKQALTWYLRLLWKAQTDRRWLRETVFPESGVCLIHGDTLSTLLGMQMARAAGLQIAHVEAGLRSFHWYSPFPEELIRIICMRYADLLFAPSRQAESNLRQMRLKGQIILVEGNTVADSLRWIRANAGAHADTVRTQPYALATCHRTETIANRHRLQQVVDLLNMVAGTMQVVFVVHGPTRAALARSGLDKKLRPTIILSDLMDYGEFISLLVGAQIALTDGGSIQEECAYLEKPCLILRNQTERADGLGRTAALWRFDNEFAGNFVRSAGNAGTTSLDQLPQPSAQIVECLAPWG